MDSNNKISRSSLHVEVTDRLREMIYERSLSPGERIDELGLSARLGTSRTPLREALKVLAHEGLVKLVPGRGAFVTELSPNEVDTFFPVLGMLQSRCTAEAVRRQTAEDIAALDLYNSQIESAVGNNRIDDYHRAVDRFHERLQHMAANPWLVRSIIDLRRFLQLIRNMMPPSEARLRQSMAEYRTLMKAIHRKDADAAEQIVSLQVTAQQRAWRSQQAQQSSPDGDSSASGHSNSRRHESSKPLHAEESVVSPQSTTGPDPHSVQSAAHSEDAQSERLSAGA
ncbi:MAG: GntR family transcriptional regulator [Lautropia sp.]|nr:GntR family transcriptional regulator [Lautropia sp.]